MSYLDRLKRIDNGEIFHHSPKPEPTKPTEPPFNGFVGSIPEAHGNIYSVNGNAEKPLSRDQDAAIRTWLAHIEEADPDIIADTLTHCQTDPEALAYFLGRAGEVPHLDDDRCTCAQCANLSERGVCLAAKRGEFFAGRNYQPVRDLPRRCEGYSPGLDDPDRRHGRERWPGLVR